MYIITKITSYILQQTLYVHYFYKMYILMNINIKHTSPTFTWDQ